MIATCVQLLPDQVTAALINDSINSMAAKPGTIKMIAQ